MQTINLEVTLDEVNLILEALGNQPYVAVSQLIGKIQQQASTQLRDSEGNSTPQNQED